MGGLLPTPVSSSQAVRTEGNQFCQQPEGAWEWLPPQLSLRRDMRPVHTMAAALSDPEQRPLLSHVQTPDPEHREMVKVCGFKVLQLR